MLSVANLSKTFGGPQQRRVFESITFSIGGSLCCVPYFLCRRGGVVIDASAGHDDGRHSFVSERIYSYRRGALVFERTVKLTVPWSSRGWPPRLAGRNCISR